MQRITSGVLIAMLTGLAAARAWAMPIPPIMVTLQDMPSTNQMRGTASFQGLPKGVAVQISGQLLKLTLNHVRKFWFRKAFASTATSLGNADHIPSIPHPRTKTSHAGPPEGEGSRCARRTVTLQATLRQVCVPEPPPPMQRSKNEPVAAPLSS